MIPRHKRYALIKHVYKLRCDRLEAEKLKPWPKCYEDRIAYGNAVYKYIKARKRWRRIRGFD